MITSPRAVSHAVATARREGAELIACFIISHRVPESVSSWLIYIGFMGDKPSSELKTAISDHYRQRAQSQLEEFEAKAREQGIPCRTLLLEGDLVEEGVRVAREEKVDLVLLDEPDRSDFDHLFFAPVKENLTQRLKCPVETAGGERSET